MTDRPAPRIRRAVLAVLLAVPSLAPASADGLGAAIAGGEATVDARLRHERAEQDNAVADADATTFRLRLGYATGEWAGFDAFAEYEGVYALGGDDGYNSGPAFLAETNGRTGYSTIADPAGDELNRAWLRYRGLPGTEAKVGRQRLILDNARFVGNVGWRDNEQTFDAVALVNESLPGVTLTYAWLRRQNFIFFNDNRLDGHLLNARWAVYPRLTLVAYAYFIDFDDDAGPRAPGAPDHRDLGLRASGSLGPVDYSLEYADQSDHADAPDSVDAEYWAATLGAPLGPLRLDAGYESLGGDGSYAFQFPLATNHKFQGWADLFLATPAAGLRDAYAGVGGKWAGTTLKAVYHDFSADTGGADYGSEWDLLAARPVTPRLTLLAKFADYDAETFAVDTRRYWLQAEYRF
ncbi:hypothetical protein PC39_00355 [Salinisphaera sp. PC39]|uniref:alginate export family protein n=1 Tax=Salinisphaera sp. PC39 TaxID=1304156 RepID=UPI003341CD42